MRATRSQSGIAASRQFGFTLVELLVVIGIIAVLVGILLPVLGKAREHAQRAKCASNLHQQSIYLQMYLNQFKGNMPIGIWQDRADLGYVMWQQTFKFNIGVGLVVAAGIVSDQPAITTDAGEGRVFYCPTQTNQGSGYNDQGNEWYGTPGAATRMSYTQRPEWYYETGQWYCSKYWNPLTTNGSYVATPTIPWFPKVNDYKNKAILIDLFVEPTHESFFAGHKTGVNMLNTNWSVQWVQFDKLQPMIDNLKGIMSVLPPGTWAPAQMRPQYYALWKRLDSM